MRDLLFKNLTSSDRKRKIIASAEISDKQGVRSIIRRHFVCIAKEVEHNKAEKPLPYVRVIKEHNSREQKEKFFCKIKGSVYVICNGRIFLIVFMHSLRINLVAIEDTLNLTK